MNLSDAPERSYESTADTENCFKITSYENVSMTKLKIIKNLIVISLTFLFLFSAFMALANLQSTLNNVGNIGVVSQSLIYAALIVSSLFLPKLIINKIGCKLTLVISVLSYAPYIAANVYPKTWILLPTAILLGVGGATLWCSANTYINDLSFCYAYGNAEKAKLSTPIFFGTFFMFFNTTQIWGNMISFLVLSPSDSNSSDNFTLSSNLFNTSILSCGAEFCGGTSEILQPPPEEKIFILISIYFAFAILSAVVVSIFMDKLEKIHNVEKIEDSVIMNLLATFNQLKNVNQRLLVALTIYTGLELGFLYADFTEAYIACASGLQNVGLILTYYGIVNAAMCFLGGYIIRFVPRVVLMTTAAFCSIGLYITLFAWVPNSEQSWIFTVIITIWGFSDGIWLTQTNALYGVLFRENEEAAFANLSLWRSLGLMISFGSSSLLCTTAKIYIQIIFLFVGFIGYIIIEFRVFLKKNFYVV